MADVLYTNSGFSSKLNYNHPLKNDLYAIVDKVYTNLESFNELDKKNLSKSFYDVYELIENDLYDKDTIPYCAIRYRRFSELEKNDDILEYAFPEDPLNISLPVVGELVQIVNGVNYKLVRTNNSPNFNTIPEILSQTKTTPNKSSKSIKQKEDEYNEVGSTGISNSTISNNNTNKTRPGFQGEYFKQDVGVHQLSLREGDNVIQGRFGNSIRFSGYLHDNKTKGDFYPSILIRNGESGDNKIKKVFDVVDEDINNDGSSIHITSGEYISKYQPPTNKSKIYKFPSNAKGEQIVINSDRIVISSKGTNTYIQSNQNVSISANDVINLDSSQIELTSDDGHIKLKTIGANDIILAPGSGGRIIFGDDNTNFEPINPNQMLLGNELIAVLSKLIQAINTMTFATPSGPTAPGPIDKTTFLQLEKELKDCLSKINYVT